MSRRGRDGVEQVGSAGFTAALFDHRTSRTGDPQLHTHALVVNKVRCDDGRRRTLDGLEIYHHRKAAGVVYQAEVDGALNASHGGLPRETRRIAVPEMAARLPVGSRIRP